MALETTSVVSAYITEIDYVGTSNPIYIGHALIGSPFGMPIWQIQHLTYDGANNLTSIRFAGGSHAFEWKWDDRAGLTYS